MQSDLGKLFIGGISWDTDEERLKEYFSGYGEVLEAVIMRDRNTGRARGFGFIVFADSSVAERVILEKHTIDGRMVEAKKAVPRDDQSTMSRSSSSIQGSPGIFRTRKIFVGGLASTITENEFKKYFEQYGTITDAVVMYDHNTQRPRGFGFITYDSEEAVEKVLMQTFHELNGKMVEVKRAVPKELSPSPIRSPISSGGGYNNHGFSVINKFLNDYNAIGGYDVRMDGRFNPIAPSRSGFAPFGSSYGMGLNFEQELNLNQSFGGNASFNNDNNNINSLSYGREMKPFYVGNSNRIIANPIGYDGGNGGNSSFFGSSSRNLWGNGVGSNSIGYFSNSGVNWTSSSPIVPNRGVENLGYGSSAAGPVSLSSYAASSTDYDIGAFSDLYSSRMTGYDDSKWCSTINERDGSGSFDYMLGNGGSDIVRTKTPPGYVVGGYEVIKRQTNRGIPG
ncbi:heterogeneous nuclear ribonucleoprotein 1-like [Impatiens glandulifera]|uniref:heterogeneous nuclear ribonucleoprotein 1-like n=1 Tax=Impatiens glandulifera TaxID=253017 RepID=UPI001FB17B2A|nr:heterogeneous nuclear ribonucleoprotein 1-like [Impatiens glandulifera]XP_047333837.1 heterogeneous nuclear ribonucleoprotein 1-like [Impatiens glandulifera]XP_047333838.1 heterogeneous nuclear ribonucleoprotein 1-like [Impatiens glandulifera]